MSPSYRSCPGQSLDNRCKPDCAMCLWELGLILVPLPFHSPGVDVYAWSDKTLHRDIRKLALGSYGALSVLTLQGCQQGVLTSCNLSFFSIFQIWNHWNLSVQYLVINISLIWMNLVYKKVIRSCFVPPAKKIMRFLLWQEKSLKLLIWSDLIQDLSVSFCIFWCM